MQFTWRELRVKAGEASFAMIWIIPGKEGSGWQPELQAGVDVEFF